MDADVKVLIAFTAGSTAFACGLHPPAAPAIAGACGLYLIFRSLTRLGR